jgi:hypothetical protein
MMTGLLLTAGVCFVGYLLYTRQFKWLFGFARSAFLGAVGILAANTLLIPAGIAVGVNAMTLFIVGILGLPGLLLLYAAQTML